MNWGRKETKNKQDITDNTMFHQLLSDMHFSAHADQKALKFKKKKKTKLNSFKTNVKDQSLFTQYLCTVPVDQHNVLLFNYIDNYFRAEWVFKYIHFLRTTSENKTLPYILWEQLKALKDSALANGCATYK